MAELVDTVLTVAWALAAWIVFLATVAAILALAAIVTGAYGVRALRQRAAAPSWARCDLRARIYVARRLRRSSGRTRPRWSHSQPLDYEEAA